jgi:sugar phosphate isomerase/epimerase
MGLLEQLEATRAAGVSLFQICDFAAIEAYSDGELAELRSAASELHVALELGTRGITPARLKRYLELAIALDVTLVRSMITEPAWTPTPQEAEKSLRSSIVAFEDHGVTLALETYEQNATPDLVRIIEKIGSPNLGICLDPANTVPLLEVPADTIELCAPHVVNLHIKDFAFSRREAWVGFTLAGALLGEGMLDYRLIRDTIDPQARGLSQIVEHWLPWQGDIATTRKLEEVWTAHSLNYLKEHT